MRSVFVVVRRVLAQHRREVSAAEDQEPVEAFAAGASDPALGVRPRLWRAHRRFDHADAFGAEDLVELTRELAVAVAVTDQNPRPTGAVVVGCISRLRACWVTQRPSGLVVIPARWTRRLASSMKNRT